jgi:hypothetical protein
MKRRHQEDICLIFRGSFTTQDMATCSSPPMSHADRALRNRFSLLCKHNPLKAGKHLAPKVLRSGDIKGKDPRLP